MAKTNLVSVNSGKKGLSSKEAASKLRQFGYNEMPAAKKRNIITIIWGIISEPMILLLVSACLIYAFLGDPADAVIMIIAVVMVIGITLFQEKRTEQALMALKNMASPLVYVIRDGQKIQIASRLLVPGDLILIGEGQRAPADGLLLENSQIMVDESLLTGESVPVNKVIYEKTMPEKKLGGENQPYIYNGTLIVKGSGLMLVTQTGINTEMGKIGKALHTIEKEETLLNIETRRLVKIFGLVGLVLCTLAVFLYVSIMGDWFNGLLIGISLSLSMLPEEFPLVLTIFLTLGAWRIAKNKVLTRNMSVIETLGATTVLCVDKTGTLTQNKIILEKIWTENKTFLINSGFLNNSVVKSVFHTATLATQINSSDPLDQAVLELCNNKSNYQNLVLIKEYPFSSLLPMSAQVWRQNNGKLIVSAKGAPETIIKLCKLNQKTKIEILNQIKQFSNQGLRVLAVAEGEINDKKLPVTASGFKLNFSSLLAFGDPIQKTVKAAINQCYEAGIRVAMITGDYPATAQNIAQKINLKNWQEFITGDDLEKLSLKEIRQKIKTVNIFARIKPTQKLKIVEAFKANGEIVAMTGDGVNDAPALKAANVGLAMGKRGADVAREASDMILLNNDFGSLVEAIKQGRQIYDNLQKAMSYIVSVHIPIAGITLLPIIFKMPIVLMPAHIAFLEIIIDPACSTVFESEQPEDDIMKRSPRNLKSPILGLRRIMRSIIEGFAVLWLILAVYFYANSLKFGEDEIRNITYTSIILLNLALILISRSWTKPIFALLKSPNKSWRLVFAITLSILILILTLPFLRDVFHFEVVPVKYYSLGLLASLLLIIWFELEKFVKNYDRKV